MIRSLQKDNRVTKTIFAVIISVAVLSMVVYLIPGLYDGISGTPQGVYATVHTPGIFGRVFGDSTEIKTTEVAALAQSLGQRQGLPAQYLPFLMPRLEAQAQQMLLATAIETREAKRLGLEATEEDVRRELQSGQLGALLFPGGQYIGDAKYDLFIQQVGYNSKREFEDKVREEVTTRRLVQFVTAGATVSDNAVRELVRNQGMKIKFDYAAIESADIAKAINPIDSDLQKFFTSNSARYAKAVPEKRKVEYIAVSAANLPGGKPQVSDADMQAYYTAHAADYHVDQQVKVRHILIKSAQGADAKTDAAAKAKAQDLLNKIRGGADFAALAKANSDDPGSKDSGGELGYVKANGAMVPEFQKAAMALKAGETSDLVRTSFGWHIIQATARDESHQKPLAEVAAEIRPVLEQGSAAKGIAQLAQQVAADAAKVGMDKAAADHGLKATTTDAIASDGAVEGLADSTQLVQAAFAGKKGDAPRVATGGPGTSIVYQTVDVQPAHAPSFDDWKSHVTDDYKAEQVPQLLQVKVAKLAQRAKELGDLKKAAAEMNVTVKTSDLVDRTANVPEVGAMSGPASAAFNLPKGGISDAMNEGQTGVVLQILDKQEPSTDEIVKGFKARRSDLIEQQRAELFGVYMQTLLDSYTKSGAIKVAAPVKGATNPPLGI